MPNIHRLAGRCFSVLISIVFALLLPRLALAQGGLTLCQITDTVYRADGSPAQGDVVIVWSAFTTAAGQPVATGNLTVTLGSGGQFSAALAPNAGATPAGTYYRVTYKLNDDTVQPAWLGEYKVFSDLLPAEDVLSGNAVQVSAPLRGAVFTAIVRNVELQVISLADDRSQYDIKFATDADEPIAFKLEAITLTAPRVIPSCCTWTTPYEHMSQYRHAN
jgi:hypothetical protein